MMGQLTVLNIGVLAQLVEQWTLNPFVASSTLARPTKLSSRNKWLQEIVAIFFA